MASQREVLQCLCASITIEVMRRAARMVLSCLPQAATEDVEAQASIERAPSPDAEARAGDPSSIVLPPVHMAARGSR